MFTKQTTIIIAVAVAIIGIGAAAVFYGGGGREAKAPSDTVATTSADSQVGEATVPETKQATEGWRSYENKAYRFALLYPQELSVREYKEADGAMSATFEERAEGRGFQIYVTPYGADVVTQERFRLDLPSGVIGEPQDVIIDGVRGTMFWSENSIMGQTREVWFINGGYLYEVVTYKQLDAWLAEIMQTWKFTL